MLPNRISHNHLPLYGLIFLLAFLGFIPVLGGGFVFDDFFILVDTPNLAGYAQPLIFFTESLDKIASNQGGGNVYRPLFLLLLWLVGKIAGGSAFAYHLFGVCAHLLATFACLLLLRQLFQNNGGAVVVGTLIFALHPVHVEAVAWVSALNHVIATLFASLAAAAHIRFQRENNGILYGLALCSLFAALFTQEMAVTLPLVLVALNLCLGLRTRLFPTAGYFLAVAVYLLLRQQVLDRALPFQYQDLESLLRVGAFAGAYIKALLFPWPQPYYFSIRDFGFVSTFSLLFAAVAMGALLWQLLRRPASWKTGAFGLLWIVITLAPGLYAALHEQPVFALRILYLPSVGFALLAAWLFSLYWGGMENRRLYLAVLLTAAVALPVSYLAEQRWRDNERFFKLMIADRPDHYLGYYQLGDYYMRLKDYEKALPPFQAAEQMAIDPPARRANLNDWLGLIHGMRGETAPSNGYFQRAVELNPELSSSWVGLGNNALALNRLEDAVGFYTRAYKADPDNRIAYYNLSLVYRQLGNRAEAKRFSVLARGVEERDKAP